MLGLRSTLPSWLRFPPRALKLRPAPSGYRKAPFKSTLGQAVRHSSNSSSSPKKPPRSFSDYLNELRNSSSPGTDTASLIASFLILHELTAIVPLFVGFGIFKWAGLGEKVAGWFKEVGSTPTGVSEGGGSLDKSVTAITRQKVAGWMDEGTKRAEKVGRRYGIFGYPKRTGEKEVGGVQEVTPVDAEKAIGRSLSGDLANAVAAYLIVKALIPFRLGISLYFTPSFARGIVQRVKFLRNLGSRNLQKAKVPDATKP